MITNEKRIIISLKIEYNGFKIPGRKKECKRFLSQIIIRKMNTIPKANHPEIVFFDKPDKPEIVSYF